MDLIRLPRRDNSIIHKYGLPRHVFVAFKGEKPRCKKWRASGEPHTMNACVYVIVMLVTIYIATVEAHSRDKMIKAVSAFS